MGNSKNLIIFGAIALIALLLMSSYNGMIGADQGVKSKWAEVENNYQRRSDLIPNLISTVKGEKDFEQSTLIAVTEARSKATQMKVDATNLTPEKVKEYQEAQGQLGSALGRLLSISENYPNLKANEAFRGLSAELAGTENRIKNARKDFNESVLTFNAKVLRFPANIVAGIFGFREKGYFQADAGSKEVPKVDFTK